MLERQMNLWDAKDGAICITTNGNIKKNGEAVMGRGCALEASQKYPLLAGYLGRHLKTFGNCVFTYVYFSTIILTFPTKHNWWEPSDIKLIEKSAYDLLANMKTLDIHKVYLPRPGCGNGGLSWEKEVKPLLEKILPDNIIVVHD